MKEALYEGKAKKVYATDNPNEYLVYYKDDATAFNGEKKGTIHSKGILNNKISAFFFEMLTKAGVPNHFVRIVSDREMLVKKLEILQIEVVVRNIAAGSLAKRIGWEEGRKLPLPIVEFYYKDDALGDPLINEDHARVLNLATDEQMKALKDWGLKINSILSTFLKGKKVELIDFKLEFGIHNGELLLGDEISPDTCRFWDTETGQKLDKDRFRRDLGDVEAAYKEVLRRLTGEVC
ncbi:MAG: purC [Firmicutes bacterium]|nr:purC [Bacillota bacterium]